MGRDSRQLSLSLRQATATAMFKGDLQLQLFKQALFDNDNCVYGGELVCRITAGEEDIHMDQNNTITAVTMHKVPFKNVQLH